MSPAQLAAVPLNPLGSDASASPTSAAATRRLKVIEKDPLTGQDVKVLWVKGSGGDLGTMKLGRLRHPLYMDKFLSLEPFYQGKDSDSVLVPLYSHCTFNLNPRAASIDTPLHGLRDRAHVDHMHPRCFDRHRRVRRQQGTDQRDLWRRDWLVAVDPAWLRVRPRTA